MIDKTLREIVDGVEESLGLLYDYVINESFDPELTEAIDNLQVLLILYEGRQDAIKIKRISS